MSGDAFQRAAALFLEARRLGVAQRDAFLDQACAGDAPLRAQVERLLSGAEQPLPFATLAEDLRPVREQLAAAAPVTITCESPAGGVEGAAAPSTTETIGPYRLLQKIGEGGFGSVYMAEQLAPVRRKVALKILKLGMDTRQLIARFEAERQALALMDHPNIAHVFDAGATPTGRPYFAMELVRGVPITHYCDERQLPTAERIELFLAVCGAVQHAHQKGVIHRDIKPSNVLVTLHDGVPVPKVIDFGIAKATGPALTEKTLFTEFGQLIGTPEYMSPEQAGMSALDIDTRCDVYALGVLLYELLTGTTPFMGSALRSAPLPEVLRIIREVEPPRPSTRLSSLLTGGAKGSRGRGVRGGAARAATEPSSDRQLDIASSDGSSSIVQIATTRRAEPALLLRQLRGDLDWIVMKCLEKDRSRRYEAASALAADLRRHLGGEPVLAAPPGRWYRLRKLLRRNRVAATFGAVLATVVLAALAVVSVLLHQATVQRDRALEAEGQQRVERERATAAADKAQAVSAFLQELLASANPDLAQKPDLTVNEALGAAVKRLDAGSLAGQPQVEYAVRSAVGDTYFNLGRYGEAEAQLRLALAQAIEQHPGDNEEVAVLMHALGETLDARGAYSEAAPVLRDGLAMLRRLFGDEHSEVGACLNELAINRKAVGELEEAEALYREALGIIEKLHAWDSKQAATALNNLSLVLAARGNLEEAEAMQRHALALRRELLGDRHPDVAFSLNSLAGLLREKGDLDGAEQLYREALTLRRSVLGDEHPDLATSINNLGLLLDARGRLDEAIGLHRAALAMRRKLLGPANPETAASLNNLALALTHKGELVEAEPLFHEALDILRRTLGDRHANVATSLWNLADLLEARGDAAAAEAALREMLAVRVNLHGQRHVAVASAQARLSLCLLRERKYDQAEPLLRVCLRTREKLLRPDDWLIPQARSMLGEALAGQGKFDEAEPLLLGACSELGSDSQAPPARRREARERVIRYYEARGDERAAAEWRERGAAASRPGL